jgi:hypothetical protein
MTTLIAMTFMLIGAVLGLRFKVFVLLPATVLSSAAALSAGLAYSDSPWSILLTAALAMATLQMGYLAGAVFNASAMIRPELSRWRKVWLARHNAIS